MIERDVSKKGKTVIFNSYNEFIEFAKTKGVKSEASHKTKEGEWSGTKTWEEAVNLALNGWPEALDKIKDKIDLTRRTLSRNYDKPALVYDVSGSYPDVGLYLSGEPNCMVEFTTQETECCKVVYDTTVNCGISKKEMMKGGLEIIALVDTLEAMGYNTEVWWCMTTVTSNYKMYTKVRVKSPLQYWDPHTMAFSIGNPAMFRRFGFAFMEAQTPEIRQKLNVGCGYGQQGCTDEEGDIKVDLKELVHDKNENWIMDTLKERGFLKCT